VGSAPPPASQQQQQHQAPSMVNSQPPVAAAAGGNVGPLGQGLPADCGQEQQWPEQETCPSHVEEQPAVQEDGLDQLLSSLDGLTTGDALFTASLSRCLPEGQGDALAEVLAAAVAATR
jgi:hypothetical protein